MSRPRKKPTCRCLDEINRQLADRGHRLDMAFTISGEVFPMLKTERVPPKPGEKPKRRAGTPLVPATHCPFCGTAYQKGVPR